MTALLVPGVVLRVPGRHRLAGQFTGAAAVVDQLRTMLGRGAGRQQIVAYENWLDSEQRVLVIVRAHMDLPGRVHEWRRLFLFELAGAKITRVDLFEDDQQALR